MYFPGSNKMGWAEIVARIIIAIGIIAPFIGLIIWLGLG